MWVYELFSAREGAVHMNANFKVMRVDCRRLEAAAVAFKFHFGGVFFTSRYQAQTAWGSRSSWSLSPRDRRRWTLDGKIMFSTALAAFFCNFPPTSVRPPSHSPPPSDYSLLTDLARSLLPQSWDACVPHLVPWAVGRRAPRQCATPPHCFSAHEIEGCVVHSRQRKPT